MAFPQNLLTLESPLEKQDPMSLYRALVVDKINTQKRLIQPVDEASIRAEIDRKLAAGEPINIAGTPKITIDLDMPMEFRKKIIWDLYNMFPGKLEIEVDYHVIYADSSSKKWFEVESDSALSNFMPLEKLRLQLTKSTPTVGDLSPSRETDVEHRDKKLKQ